jgi:2-octaprenyl-6-methoxyphenol hydroxylase
MNKKSEIPDFATLNFDIVIIGGSYSGMTAALTLANISDDLKIAVIEKQDIVSEDKKRDGRAYAISNASLELFKEIAIYCQVIKDAGEIKDIRITDYKSSIILDFLSKKTDKNHDNFGFIIESYVIHNALKDQLVQRKNVTLLCPNFYQAISFEDDLAVVKIDDQRIIRSKLLLACDGRFSNLRDHFKIATTRKDYQQIAIVFNIKHQKPHQNIAYEKFLPYGPLAILPLSDQNKSSIVWILKDSDSKAVLGLDEKNFTHQLVKKMQNCLGEVEIISKKFSYPLTLIEADQFYYQKMLLIGDAACGVHPIAGQGFNLGVANIKILERLVKQYYLCGLNLGSDLLIKEYNKKAKFGAKKMVIATDVLNSLFETKNSAVKIARNLGMGIVNKVPKLKKIFIKNAGGVI